MRLIRHDMKHPFRVRLGDLPGMPSLTKDEKVLGYEIHICACGLSNNKPFCDGSHKATQNEEEGRIYSYDSKKNQSCIDPHYKETDLPNAHNE
jgi:CDGSH-type Zn-finger protein